MMLRRGIRHALVCKSNDISRAYHTLANKPLQNKCASSNDRATSILFFAQRPGLFQNLTQSMFPQLLQEVEAPAK